MLIGFMSDSHDSRDNLIKAISVFNEKKVTAVYHAGDITSLHVFDIIQDLHSSFDAVFGNSDIQKFEFMKFNGGRFNFHHGSYEWEREGKSFFMTHKPEEITKRTGGKNFNYIIHGHTHTSSIKIEGKTVYINPGEVAGNRSGKATIALLDMSSSKIEIIQLK